MEIKLKLQGLLASNAISHKELAHLLFSKHKFPESALRRLMLTENYTLEQVQTLAKHFNIDTNELIQASFAWYAYSQKPKYRLVIDNVCASVIEECCNVVSIINTDSIFNELAYKIIVSDSEIGPQELFYDIVLFK